MDKKLKERIEETKKLVLHRAQTFLKKHKMDKTHLEDLVQEGKLAVVHAHGLFDEERGCQFSTYAYMWITKYLQTYYYDQGFCMRLPQNSLNPSRKKNNYLSALEVATGFLVAAEDLEQSKSKVDCKTPYIHDFVFKKIPENEKVILQHLYGVGEKKLSVRDTATLLGLSPATILARKKKGIERIKNLLTKGE